MSEQVAKTSEGRLRRSELKAVRDFQGGMIEALRANAYKGTWQEGFTAREALRRLHDEVDELVVALEGDNRQLIVREAADVANFAMMIADLRGGLLRE